MKKITIVLMICFICGTAWAIKGDSIDSEALNAITLTDITVGSCQSFFAYDVQIRSVTLKDGLLEVIEVMPSTFSYPEGGSPPGTAIKYIYAAKDGKVYLKEKVEGKYYPESFELKPESIEFGD